MLVKEAESKAHEALKRIYSVREAHSVADILLEDITGLRRIDRLTAAGKNLSEAQAISFERCLGQLLNHRPIQYVIQKSWFYGMELFVNEHVLIPRPETEELVEWVVTDVRKSNIDVFSNDRHLADRTSALKVLDVGTGSGCIALALRKTMPKAEVWGCDKSEEALDVARRNSSVLGVRVDLQGIDFLDARQQRQLPTFDIIVSNPPYIPLAEKEQLAPNVINFEPHSALFVPNNDPLIFYRALSAFGKIRLHAGGHIYLETHESYNPDVVGLFISDGYAKVESRKDMQGKERFVKASI